MMTRMLICLSLLSWTLAAAAPVDEDVRRQAPLLIIDGAGTQVMIAAPLVLRAGRWAGPIWPSGGTRDFTGGLETSRSMSTLPFTFN